MTFLSLFSAPCCEARPADQTARQTGTDQGEHRLGRGQDMGEGADGEGHTGELDGGRPRQGSLTAKCIGAYTLFPGFNQRSLCGQWLRTES